MPRMPGRLSTLAALFLGRPRTRHDHFDALDGLRGLAVLIVIASHMSLLGFPFGVPMGGAGKSGVYLFFVLSAFLLTRLLLARPLAAFREPRVWLAYALRRVLRIWPLYLLVLLSGWALTSAGVAGWHFQLDTGALLRHLALVEGQSVLWSIPVEFKFYAWLPLVAFALAWMAHRGWTLAAQGAVVALALALATLAWPPAQTQVNDVRLGPYLVLFLCGAAAAALDHRLGPRGPARAAWGVAGAVALAAFVATLPASWAALTGQPLVRNINHTWFLLFGLAWSTLLLAVLRGPRLLGAVFAWAPLRVVGVVSFSAYLWHMPVIDGFRLLRARDWPGAPAWVLLAILLVSLVSFLLVERPWRDVRLPAGAGATRPQAPKLR